MRESAVLASERGRAMCREIAKEGWYRALSASVSPAHRRLAAAILKSVALDELVPGRTVPERKPASGKTRKERDHERWLNLTPEQREERNRRRRERRRMNEEARK